MTMKGNLSGQRVDAGSADIPEGESGAIRATKQRALHVNLRDNDGAEIGSGTGLPVSGTVAIDQTTDGETNGVSVTNPTIEKTVGAAVGTLALMAGGSDGTNVRHLKTDASGELQVDVLSNALPTGAATNAKLDEVKALLGEVQATPTDNTVLDRLKDLLTGIVLAAGTNLFGDVDLQPRTTGGWTVANFTSGDNHTALTNSAQVIKASAGKLGGYYFHNPNAASSYIHIYNIAAASVTVGTSTAPMNFCIPAGSSANLDLGAGIAFDTAMSIAATTTGGGNTAPTTALEVMVWYK